MKRNLKTVLAAITVSAAMVLTACSSGGEDPGQGALDDSPTKLRIGTNTEVVQWSPLNSVSISDIWVMGHHFPQLFYLNENSVAEPYVAERFEVSEDGKHLTFFLSDDFMWSDGEPLTADDVVFTFERMKSDKLRAGLSAMPNLEKAEAISDTEVVLTMKVPSYSWADDVVRATTIMPKHVFESVENISEFSMAENPDSWVSGASFVLSKIVPGQRYEFVPNEYYPRRAAGNEEITSLEFIVYGDMNTMQLALRKGDIDMIAPAIPSSSISSLSSSEGVKINELKDALNYSKLTFNVSRGNELEDPVVRQVISGLIDTQSLVDTVLQGHGTNVLGPILPIYADYQPAIEPWKYTPDEAKKILADNGYSNLKFNLGCDQGNANHAKYAQIIRDQLQEADIEVTLACAERTVSLDTAKSGGFDLYIHKLNQASSPGTNLVYQFDPENPVGLQYNFFDEEPTLSKLLEAAETALNEDDYKVAVKEVAKYIHEQAYVLPLYVEALNIAYRGDRFEGFMPTGMETSTMVNERSLGQAVPQ